MGGKKDISLSVKYQGFRVLKYEYEEPLPEHRRRKIGHFNYEIGFRPVPDKETLFVRMRVDLRVGAPKGQLISRIKTESEFRVQQLSELVVDNKFIKLPDQFLTIVFGLHYSTTRGALITKGAGTLVERLIMPIIPPSQLVPQGPVEYREE